MPPASKADKKAAVDAAAWMFNVVTSVGIIIVNEALMASYGFSFVVFDKIWYSRDTKLSILVILLGVAVCTVTYVSVNAKGFIAAFIAVWNATVLCSFSSKKVFPNFIQSAGAHCTQPGCITVVFRPISGLLVDKQENRCL